MKRFFCLALLCLMLLITCCSKQSPKKVKLLLDWQPNPLHVPIFAGKYSGIFKKYGINIVITHGKLMPDTINSLLSKENDIAIYYMPHTIRAATLTDKLKVVGTFVQCPLNGFLFLESSKIYDLLDFHMKTFYGPTQGLLEKYIKSALTNSGIKFTNSTNLDCNFIESLLNKTVDVLTGVFWNIEGEQLSSTGAKISYLPYSIFNVPDYHELIFISTKDFLKNDKTFVKNFQRAINECIYFSKENPDLSFDYYIALNSYKSLKDIEWERLSWKKTINLFSLNQNFQRETWDTFHEWMIDNQIISKEADLNKLLKYNPQK